MILPSNSHAGPNNVALDIMENIISQYKNVKFKVFYFKNSPDNIISFPPDIESEKINFFDEIDFNSFDVFHSHMIKADAYLCINKLRRRLRGKPILTTIHQKDFYNLKSDFQSPIKAILVSFIWRLLLINFDRIICLSRSMVKFYCTTLPKSKLTYIYNGRSLSGKLSEHSQSITLNKNKIIGTSCYLTERKGLDQVIKVLNDLPDVKFHIAGIGPDQPRLAKLVKQLSLEDRVVFLGHCKDIENFLNSIDVYILPSRAEGFPLSLLEATSIGKPCVASNIDIITEAFSSDEISIFKLDDRDSLIDGINYAFENSRKLSENVKIKHDNNFTPETMANKYMEQVLRLIHEV
jgi:glycosyltransferase involved in cell wall biosynthesis